MHECRPEVKSVCAYLSRSSTLQHPACFPNLARSDYHSFPTLWEFLGGRRVKSDEEVKDDSNACLHGLAAEVHGEGLQTLVTVYDKRLNVSGDYIEKYPRLCNCVTLNLSLFLFPLFFFIKISLYYLHDSHI